MSVLRDVAWSISGWDRRRKEALSPLADRMRIGIDSLHPDGDWNAIPTAEYLAGPPFSYYFEPAFIAYRRFLNSRFKDDLRQFVDDLANCGQDIWRGLTLAEGLALEIEAADLGDVDDYRKVTSYLNPWYLRLIEQAFDSLLTLPAYRLQMDAGKNVTLTPRSIYDVMKKHGWHAAGAYYDSTMRNGIGHDIEFIQDSFASAPLVRYTDSGGTSLDLSLHEITENVYGVLDECLAYCFALRLFILENRDAVELQHVIRPSLSTFAGREMTFRRVAGSRFVAVTTVNRERINGQVQIRIECTDHTTHDQERLLEIVSLLTTVGSWFPEGETFFLGLKGKSRWPAFIRISATDLRSWIAGDIADEKLVGCFNPKMLAPLKKWFGYTRAKWGRAFSVFADHMRRRLRSARRDAGEFHNQLGSGRVEDTSTGLARRYRADLVISATSQEEVVSRLPSLVAEIRSMRVHARQESKQRWGRTPPHFISGFLFSRKKRSRDRWVNPDAEYYIGKFEWRSPTVDSKILPLELSGDGIVRVDDGIAYQANPRWPPSNLYMPSYR